MIGRGSAWPLPSRRRSSSRSAASSAGISGPGPAISLLSPHDTAVVTLPEEAPPEAGDNQLSLQELIMIFVAVAPSQSDGGGSLAFCSPWRKVMHRAASHEAVPDRELSGRGCRPLCPKRLSQTGVNCLRCCSTPEEQLREGLSWHPGMASWTSNCSRSNRPAGPEQPLVSQTPSCFVICRCSNSAGDSILLRPSLSAAVRSGACLLGLARSPAPAARLRSRSAGCAGTGTWPARKTKVRIHQVS